MEKMLLERGHESRRYALEGTFWFRFAYHCYREFGKEGIELRPSINQQTGDFMLSCLDDSGLNLFHLFVPGTRVKELLNNLGDHLSNQHRMSIHPVPLKTIFKISMNTELDLDIRPQIRMIQQGGESTFFERLDLERFRYGDLIYIKELGILAQLKKQGVDFVTLTGASQNRGKIITSFNEDPDCRVILASLKAGGTGIDLISGSVVIHYDRWWNAAKEDQATDRVHRIGQKRVVQVFKLVTQGTLEEKISAIIDRKRNLMDDVIKEDSAELIKTFNREDLLVMLTPEAF
jgi:hypothetical protein